MTFPVKLCTSLSFVGDHISITACILLGIASMSHWFAIKRKNFPDIIPKAHFSELSLIRYFRSMLKAFSKWFKSFSVWSFWQAPHQYKPPLFCLSDLRVFCLLAFDIWGQHFLVQMTLYIPWFVTKMICFSSHPYMWIWLNSNYASIKLNS